MPFDLISRFRGSISLRIASLFALTFAVGLALAFSVTYLVVSESLEASSKEVITSKLRECAVVLEKSGPEGLRVFLASEKNRVAAAGFMVRVLDASGETLFLKPSIQAKDFDFKTAFQTKSDPALSQGWHALSAINDEDKFDFLTEAAAGGTYLQVGKSSEDREEILERILKVFAIAGASLILISGGLGLWYARRALAPVRDLLGTVREIENGDLTRRVVLGESRAEMRDLGETFNGMISRIEKLIAGMRESLDNLAHDIRTPLTRIRAVAEDALLADDADVLRLALEDCAESSTEISEMVDQLLSISEAEAGTLTLRLEDCDVAKLIEDVVEIYEFVAQEKQISVRFDEPPMNLFWPLDRKRVKQAIANLLDNAIKFSDAGSKVVISAKVANGRLIFIVSDEGPGIPQDELLRIWDRLYRGDRSRTTKGLGLGLSIVRSVAMAHRGEARAEGVPGAGMQFSIDFPSLNS